MEDRIYPQHIYDETRIAIMVSLLRKESIKLFPSLNEQMYDLMSADINNWFDGQASDLAPVHDFWNLTDGIMIGSKLKQIVKSLTAQNYIWHQGVDIDLKDIRINWGVGTLSEIGNPPYSYDDVVNMLNRPDIKAQNMALSDEYEGGYAPRDYYPIILRQNPKEGYYDILDGNRRTLRAILKGHSSIKADIGDKNYDFDTDDAINYWFSTGDLRKIMADVQNCYTHNEPKVLSALKVYLKYLFSISDIARVNWDLRCKDNSEDIQQFSRDL